LAIQKLNDITKTDTTNPFINTSIHTFADIADKTNPLKNETIKNINNFNTLAIQKFRNINNQINHIQHTDEFIRESIENILEGTLVGHKEKKVITRNLDEFIKIAILQFKNAVSPASTTTASATTTGSLVSSLSPDDIARIKEKSQININTKDITEYIIIDDITSETNKYREIITPTQTTFEKI
jgi:hypothetical protein